MNVYSITEQTKKKLVWAEAGLVPGKLRPLEP
jgi:hypothetical protein